MEQEKTEEAYEKLENIILSEYTTLNLAFGMMITKALDNKDHKSARFLAEKMYALAGIFEMGKYNECATMFNVVVAEQNVEDTFKVIKQLLENVDTICDFQKSRLYKHIKFQDVENPYAEDLFIKNLAMKAVYTQSALANTTTITNIGNIKVEPEMPCRI